MRKRHKASKDVESQRVAEEIERKFIGPTLNFAGAEAFKLLRTNISFSMPSDKECHIVGITSSVRGEGKSITSLNLAYMLAEAGHWVLLIEGDMRLPTIKKRLRLKGEEGLSNLLTGASEGFDVVQASGIHEQMRVITSGDIPPNPSELLGSNRMKDLLQELGQDFEYIVLDLPPVTAVSDALVVSKLTDGIVMVVSKDYATQRGVAESMRQLTYAEAKVLGFVPTGSEQASKKGKYKKYKKYGYYTSEKGK